MAEKQSKNGLSGHLSDRYARLDVQQRRAMLLLVLGLASLLLLMVINVSVGIKNMESVTHRLEEAADKNMKKFELVVAMHDTAKEREHELQMITMPLDRKSIADAREEFFDAGKEFAQLREQFIQTGLSEEEERLLATQLTLAEVASPLQHRVVTLIDEGRRSEARTLLVTEAIPAVEKVIEALLELQELQRNAASDASESTHELAHQSYEIMVITTTLFVVIGSMISWYIIRRTSHARNMQSQALTEIADMNAVLFSKTEELNAERLKSEEANRTKSEYLAKMSHELRTPLNAIIGYSEILREEALDSNEAHMAEDLEKITYAGKNLLAMVNDVLDMSKIEAGKMELYLTEFELREIVKGIEYTAKPLVEKNNNKFIIDCPEDIGRMFADQTKIQQIILNLLSNAAKFTENGRVGLKVGRAKEAGKEFIYFVVKDTGIGITKPQLAKLFKPYIQADAFISSRYGGTGLGLTISRQFCEMMKGELAVTSIPGKGSTFVMKIPVSMDRRQSVSDQRLTESSVAKEAVI